MSKQNERTQITDTIVIERGDLGVVIEDHHPRLPQIESTITLQTDDARKLGRALAGTQAVWIVMLNDGIVGVFDDDARDTVVKPLLKELHDDTKMRHARAYRYAAESANVGTQLALNVIYGRDCRLRRPRSDT